MSKKPKDKKRAPSRDGSRPMSTVDKGKLLEQLVAALHQMGNLKAEHNVFLPPVKGGTGRQIDVLVTPLDESGNVAGERVVVECKNYEKRVEIELIDAFVGMLTDVGVLPSNGIFVSVHGYTKDALERATRAGITALVFEGLTPDRLLSAVVDALHIGVFLLLEVNAFTIANNLVGELEYAPGPPGPDKPLGAIELLMFRDNAGNVMGYLPDLIWTKWVAGEIPPTFSNQEIQLTLPAHWLPIVRGKIEPVLSLSASVRVLRLATKLKGEARDHSLSDAVTGLWQRRRINVRYPEPVGPQDVTVIEDERSWLEFVNQPGAHVYTRGVLSLPRILVRFPLLVLYWPPSDRALMKLRDLTVAWWKGEIEDPRPFTLEMMEGTDLSTIWEPIMQDHPAVKKGDWINWIHEDITAESVRTDTPMERAAGPSHAEG